MVAATPSRQGGHALARSAEQDWPACEGGVVGDGGIAGLDTAAVPYPLNRSQVALPGRGSLQAPEAARSRAADGQADAAPQTKGARARARCLGRSIALHDAAACRGREGGGYGGRQCQRRRRDNGRRERPQGDHEVDDEGNIKKPDKLAN